MIFLFAAAFILTAAQPTMAVDKKKKTLPKKTIVKSTKSKNATKTKTSAQKKYDSFVDKNKNGIDDRRENLKSKVASKTKTHTNIKPVTKPAAKPIKKDTTKSSGKKKK